jgi:DNA-binding response OmpR family regulator
MVLLATPIRDAVGRPASKPHRTVRRSARSTRVLLVEDDPVTAEVFARALAQEGHVVRVARDGNQALHALRDHPPDLLILDLGLPMLPGTEVLRRLRSPHHRLLPVVIVSGTSQQVAKVDDELLAPGVWVMKPVRPRDLVAAVRELLASPADDDDRQA